MRFTRDGLLTVMLVIAALFVGSTLTKYLPSPDSFRDDPFPVAGALGETVHLRTGDITLTTLQPAKEIELNGQVAATSGVWVVVDVIYEPRDQPGVVTGGQGRMRSTDGRIFGGAQAIIANCGPANPGLPVTCQLPFEVPADALEGLILAMPAEAEHWAADHVTEIDLGLTTDKARDFAATDARITLKPSHVVQP